MAKLPGFAPLATLAMMFPEEMGMAMQATMPRARVEEAGPVRKCLLPECDKPREGNKSFCSKEHFGEFQKRQKGKA